MMGRISDFFGRLFEAQGLKSQIQTQLLVSITPFMTSYTIFFYFWVFMDWDLMNALVPSSIIFSVGTVLYVLYSQSVREEGVSLGDGPINMTLRWSDSVITEESNVILRHTSLLEAPAKNGEGKEVQQKKDKMEELKKRLKTRDTKIIKPRENDRVFKITVKPTRSFGLGRFLFYIGLILGLWCLYVFAFDYFIWQREVKAILEEGRIGEQMYLSWILDFIGYDWNPQLIQYIVFSIFLMFSGRMTSWIARKPTLTTEEINEPERRSRITATVKNNPGSAKEVDEEILWGKYMSLTEFHRPMASPIYGEENPYKLGAFIHDFPFDKTFRRVPGQLVSFKGQVFETAAIKVDASYCYWDEELEPCPIFRITSSPELTRQMQKGLKVITETGEPDIEKVTKLRSAHQAIKYAIRLRNLMSVHRATVDGIMDAGAEVAALADRALDNRAEIRRVGRPLGLTNRRILTWLILGLIVGMIFAWIMGWI